jgi:hypothetical protein
VSFFFNSALRLLGYLLKRLIYQNPSARYISFLMKPQLSCMLSVRRILSIN